MEKVIIISRVYILTWQRCECLYWWQDRGTMSLSYLQRRLQQNEEDFARISEIDLEKNSIKETPKK